MSGPVPSHLIFLSDLAHTNVGDKVRFLGCVDEYIPSSGTLVLQHAYPLNALSPVLAHVNVDHVLEALKSSMLQVGAWVNVIGYVAPVPASSLEGGGKQACLGAGTPKRVYVQAIVVWSAGAVKLEAYERALEERKRSGS